MLKRLTGIGLGLLGIATVLLGWQILHLLEVVPSGSLPSPWAVLTHFPDLLSDGEFVVGIGNTLLAWMLALVITSVTGVAAGLLTSTTPGLARPSAVAVNAFRSIPATALIPIAILLFGLGVEMKVSVAIYAIFWPVLINTVYGVANTEPMRLDAARSMRWSWWRRQLYVVLPSALPSITTGIRIASGTALVVVLSAELLGAKSGVGTVMLRYQNALMAEFVYAGVLCIGALGAIMYTCIAAAERRIVKWAPVG
ncbi:ABC transporter permease [Micromonospora sp. NPDC049051]|uniref:ABC transporter permease n=1 Tax=unclassified Micromonospora TaxID=2617518 RepID=UPI003719B421